VSVDVAFRCNGADTAVTVDASLRLLDVLRDVLGLTGAKEGCAEGRCGACCVLLDGLPVNACLVLAVQVHGRAVETVEARDAARLEAMSDAGATQCGACAPGLVQTVLWLADHPDVAAEFELEDLLAGHLCRCTGYRGILEGARRTLAAGEA